MKIVVSGLGIIGASICASLKRAGYTVFGKNRSKEPISYALAHNMIDGEVANYRGADVVFLALPPAICERELDEAEFDDHAIVADICGIKRLLEKVVYSKKRNYRYVGTHPMAGKETSGVTSASADLFVGANMIFTPCEQTDAEAIATVEQLAKAMGFGRFVRCSAKEHDEKIAITSQLAHIVSNAYVKSEMACDCHGFTGGSYQDMTRIASVDERMWTELYFRNEGPLLYELSNLIARLQEYESALKLGDEEKMRDLLREGRLLHEQFLSKK